MSEELLELENENDADKYANMVARGPAYLKALEAYKGVCDL